MKRHRFISTEIDLGDFHKNCDRKNLLEDKTTTNRKSPVLVTKFNPAVKQLKRLLIKHWQLLQQNERCIQVFQNLHMVAYSREKNLKELLKK